MELYLNSNEFSYNKAKNGGAIYFGKEQKDFMQYENKTMIIENNNFYDNYAQMFGGAIYSEYNRIYLAKIKKNNVKNNKSDILGSGIYTSDQYDNKTIDINGFIFKNNDYTSKPAYISLDTKLNDNLKNVYVGDYFPLVFSLNDEYGKVINDITKHYSVMTLKLEIELKTNKTSTTINKSSANYYLLENICTFIEGNNIYIYLLLRNNSNNKQIYWFFLLIYFYI